MLAYLLRRLLLIIPTLFGIMVINFVIVQVAPGGPTAISGVITRSFRAAASRHVPRSNSIGKPLTAWL